MRMLTRWFIENPVAANLVMVLLLVAGIATALTIRIEGFPKIPADTVSIQTLYPEMYASQVDESITQKIEKVLEGVNGIEKIHALSLDETSMVSVKKTSGHSLQTLLDDVRLRVSSLSNLPKGAEKPIISKNDFDWAAIYVQVYGRADTETLQRVAKRLRKLLLSQPEVSKVKDWGKQVPEISIELQPEMMQKYDLTMETVLQKIRESSLRAKAGVLKTEAGHINIRSDSQAYFYQDFADIVILEKEDGTRLLLEDVATINDGFAETDNFARFNGTPTVGMEILTGRKENLLKIVPVIQQVLKDVRPSLPEGVQVVAWGDSSEYILDRLYLLKDNALQGLFLVFMLLAIFLNIKLAFWVAMGVPISILGTIAVMGTSNVDYSINDLTTFGFIIALGILVDDAVVVGESVHAERLRGGDQFDATDRGVHRVAVATIYGVLTTVAAFMPLMMLDNALGKVLASFAGVVIIALLFSLFESKFILPSHLASVQLKNTVPRTWIAKGWQKVQSFFQEGLESFNQQIYLPFLKWCLAHRYSVVVVFVAMAIISGLLLQKGFVRSTFFPDVPGQIVTAHFEMDARAPLLLTIDNANHIEAIVNQLNDQLLSDYQLASKPISHMLILQESHKIQMILELTKTSERPDLSVYQIVEELKADIGTMEGTVSQVIVASEEFNEGFMLDVSGEDEASVKIASNQVKQALNDIQGVSSVRDSLLGGKPEISLKLRPEAANMGFNMERLALQIGFRFNGMEVQRVQREQEEVRIMVRGSREARNAIADLMHTEVKSDYGYWMPLEAVATISSHYTVNYIERRDGMRVNTVKAHINKTLVSPSEVVQTLNKIVIPEIKQQFPQVNIKEVGELEDINQIQSGLIKALVIIMLVIYALLAIPLKSYLMPVIIMSVVPFGFIGAVAGHLVMDLPLSLLSFFGMLALTGIIINDSLVLMTRYNQNRTDGETVEQAILHTGHSRLRAIFLTTVTTVAGLTPLMFETSEQAQYLIPAAVSLAYGEIFGTLITLILVPISIFIYEDIKGRFSKKEWAVETEERKDIMS